MSAGFEFQEKFVSHLKQVIAANLSLADELADLLNVSTDSIYRRLRCQSTFSFDEVALISKKLAVSVDGLLNTDSNQVSFTWNSLYGQPGAFYNYLNSYYLYLAEFSKIPGARAIYAANDLPLFRNFNHPTLTAFKCFYWNKAVLDNEGLNGKKFNVNLVPQEVIDSCRMAYSAYSQINSIEIWTEDTINSTIKQIEFFWESDLFESLDQVHLVIDDLKAMMDELKSECVSSSKKHSSKPGEFMLYNSEVMVGNNCVLTESGENGLNAKVFLGHNTFNSMYTNNTALIKETRLWMANLMKKSLLLSGTAEKQRARFFRKMEDKIIALERSVLSSSSNV